MQLHPATEKVPARRGVPVIVGVAAIAFLGLLVAKPWDPRPAGPAAPASASSTTRVAVATIATPRVATPTDSPGPTPPATPDIAPLGALGEIALPYTPGQAMAQCDYTAVRRDRPRLLASVTVQPPTVLLDPDASARDIRRVGWYLELQTNRAQSVFDREWRTVGRSRTQALGVTVGLPTEFSPLTVEHSGPVEATDLYRVRMVIEWYTRNLELAGQTAIVANHYQEGPHRAATAWPPFCRGVFTPAR